MLSTDCLQSRQTFKLEFVFAEEDIEVKLDKMEVVGASPATEAGRSYLPSVLERLSLTLEIRNIF